MQVSCWNGMYIYLLNINISIYILYLSVPYKEPIEKSDISFFINKDYTDLNIVITDNISNFIERLRGYVRNMTEENQQKSMQYVKNLCNLTKLYYL